eukprot:238630-Pleurochrysis_carterae.AAC.2
MSLPPKVPFLVNRTVLGMYKSPPSLEFAKQRLPIDNRPDVCGMTIKLLDKEAMSRKTSSGKFPRLVASDMST